MYGSATHWKEPAYRTEMGDFGLFEGVTRLSVNTQFEADGLRHTVPLEGKVTMCPSSQR